MTLPVDQVIPKLRVAEVVDGYTLVINQGALNGVRLNERFLVYAIGRPVKDPVSGELLGQLELVRGIGKVTHVQDRMATIRSEKIIYEERSINYSGGRWAIKDQLYGKPIEIKKDRIELTFDSPQVGDFVKRL